MNEQVGGEDEAASFGPTPRTNDPRAIEKISSRPDLPLVLLGVALLALYFRYASTWDLSVRFWVLPSTSLSTIALTEMRFWLVHGMLLVPGALLVGWGIATQLDQRTRRLIGPLRTTERRLRISALAFFVFLFLLYSAIRAVVMLDAPITDDENGILFGAQIWLEGGLTTPRLEPEGAFANLFTWSRDGEIASMDWPGGIAVRALALLTGLDHMLYALAAALTGLATAAAAYRWLGARAAIIAAAIWIVSPMALTLSATTHAHVISRLSIAGAIYFLSGVTTAGGRSWRHGIGLGASAGVGLLVRPLETAFLLAPIAIWLIVRAVRDQPDARKTLAAALLGVAPLIAAHLVYNWLITGSPVLPPRFDRAHIVANSLPPHGVLERISSHLTHNALLVAIFSVGPLLAGAAALAPKVTTKHRPVALLLGASIAAGFLLSLGHDNVGIHSVGPIHYSEAIVPIILLAAFFCDGVLARLATSRFRAHVVSMLTVYLAIGLATFSLHQLAALGRQAAITQRPHVSVEHEGISNAIIIADRRLLFYERGTGGSWVLEYANPHPDFSDDIVFVRPDVDLDVLAETFPNRSIWRMSLNFQAGTVEFDRLDAPDAR